MDVVTQNEYSRQRMIKYLENHTVTETAIRYKLSRKTVHKWKKRYDGTLESLKDQSRRSQNSPFSQRAEEFAQVKRIWSKDKNGDRLVMWHNIRKKGYSRCYQTFLRTVRKLSADLKPRKKV